jgi:preprotein translocase subunit SecF
VLQIMKDPRYDFMRRGRQLLIVSTTLVLAAAVVVAVRGVNLGIEFTGGTELQLKFAERPDVAAIRSALEGAGLASPVVTTIGEPTENEIYIRLGALAGGEGQDETRTTLVTRALRAGAAQPGRVDLNVADEATLGRALERAPGMTADRAAEVAAAIVGARKDRAIFHAPEDLAAIPGVTAELLDWLRGEAYVGPLSVRSQSYIGPAVGRELMNKAIFAILGSLVGMLLYIWLRFQLRWGLAAVLALVHDTLLTLGLFSLFDKEMSLPVVAAFLTLVGYSVNDTVVIFDRVRENLRNRVGGALASTINLSVNQTLSRTVITSGLTWLTVFALYLFGGAALRPFAFVLVVGILVGSYSTIYIASPILLLWKDAPVRKAEAAEGPGAADRPARKVRTS